MARQNNDTNNISRSDYNIMLETSIGDVQEVLDKLLILKHVSNTHRISRRNIEAICTCVCYALANVDTHLKPINLEISGDNPDSE